MVWWDFFIVCLCLVSPTNQTTAGENRLLLGESVWDFVSVCLLVCLSFCLPFCPPVCLFVSPAVCLCECIDKWCDIFSICLSHVPATHQSTAGENRVLLRKRAWDFLPVCLPACLSVCLPVCLSVSLAGCVSVWINGCKRQSPKILARAICWVRLESNFVITGKIDLRYIHCLFPGVCTGGKGSCVISAYPTPGVNTGLATGHHGNASATSTGAAFSAIKVKQNSHQNHDLPLFLAQGWKSHYMFGSNLNLILQLFGR